VPDSHFRGYFGIMEIMERFKPLAEWQANYGKSKRIVMSAKDYDFINRWRKAASLFGFEFSETQITWNNLSIGRAPGPKRYADSETESFSQSQIT
jgi:hypothetical protein